MECEEGGYHFFIAIFEVAILYLVFSYAMKDPIVKDLKKIKIKIDKLNNDKNKN